MKTSWTISDSLLPKELVILYNISMESIKLAPFAEGSIQEFNPDTLFSGDSLKWRHTDTGSVIRHTTEDVRSYFWVPRLKEYIDPVERIAQTKREYEVLEHTFGIKTVGFNPVITGRDQLQDLWIVSGWLDLPGWTVESLNAYRHSPEQLLATQGLVNKLADYWLDRKGKNAPVMDHIYSISDYLYDPNLGDFILVDVDPYLSVPGENPIEDEQEETRSNIQDLRGMAKDAYSPEAYAEWDEFFTTRLTTLGMS